MDKRPFQNLPIELKYILLCLVLFSIFVYVHELTHIQIIKYGCDDQEYTMHYYLLYGSITANMESCDSWVMPIQAINDIVGYTILPISIFIIVLLLFIYDKVSW